MDNKEPDISGGTENKAFDAEEMLDTFMNNEEMALPLLSHFVERTKSQLEEFPALKIAEDWETARRYAHMIRGAALSMGGSELGKAAIRLEKASLAETKDDVNGAYLAVCNAYDRYKIEALKFISDRTN